MKRGQRFGRGVIRRWEPASERLSPPGWKETHKKGRRSGGRVCGRRAARARERMRIRPAGSRPGHGSVRAPWPWNSGSAAYVSAKAVTAGSVAVAAGPDGSLPGMHRCFVRPRRRLRPLCAMHSSRSGGRGPIAGGGRQEVETRVDKPIRGA